MDLLLDGLQKEWQAFLLLLPRLGIALVVVVLFHLLGLAVGRGLDHAFARGAFTATHRSFFRRGSHWAVLLLGLGIALNLVGLGGAAAGLLAGGGLTAVVFGFAFRGIGENLLAGAFLAFSRPFEIDDLIESGAYKGLVKAIELRYTHIRTADGRDIFLPNAQIFNEPLINYTRDNLLRPSFTLGIDYRDDSERACELLRGVLAETGGVLDSPSASVHLAELADSWLHIECSYWVDTSAGEPSVLEVRSHLLEHCRRALLEAGFTVSSEVKSSVQVELSGALER